jgi:predicted N-acetyltransferase YhbS
MEAIRELYAHDASACVALASTVGWRSEVAKWKVMLTVGEGFGVERDGRLAGTVVLNRFGALATIAMMVVDPAQQRRGLGRRLMEHALTRARDATVSTASTVYLYATDTGRLLYGPMGFQGDQESLRLEGRGRSTEAVVCHGIRPMTEADLAAVSQLDEEAQGASRRSLLEALQAAAKRGLVIERRGRVVGFGLTTPHDGARVLGPIVARADEDCCGLAAHLAAGAVEALRMDLEPGEGALLAWARAAGLRVTGSSLRMVRGGAALPGRRGLIRALASRAYG